MKLTNASIRRYRSIEADTSFDVDPEVTCLVGKNESGKTATLQALYKSRSITPASFDEGLDYPSHKTRELMGDETIPVTVLTYELDDADAAAVEAELGPGSLTSRTIAVTTGYRYTTSAATWEVKISQAAVVQHLRSGLELAPATQALIEAATSAAELANALEAMEGPTEATQAVVDTVSSWRERRPTLRAIDILNRRRPVFVYFGDYDVMPGKVSIPRLIAKRDADDMTPGERALMALLTLAGVKLEDFLSPESHEHLIRRLENASNSISDDVFTYWSQNKSLQVQLAVIAKPEAGAAAPLDQGPLLQIRVLNQRHRVTVPFDERSRGFVWFFSFLAYFSQLEEEAQQPLILLLDEPGLSLHATAQHDLLKFIDKRLAPKHQVLFSTHSPFMIDAQKFGRVRTVVDQDPSGDRAGGTTVSTDVLRVDNESAFPLHAALGIELTQTLFIGPEVLIVEGPSDVVYLQHMSDQLKAAGREGLDDRWVIVPGGGITKLPAFLTLFGANDLTVVVLTDSATNNEATLTELRKAGKLYAAGLVQVGEVLDRAEADVEDLLDPAMYLELVNAAYGGVLGRSRLTVKNVNLKGHERIVKAVEAAFIDRGINNGRLNHFAPAGALMRTAGGAPLADEVLDRAEQLMAKINEFLPERP